MYKQEKEKKELSSGVVVLLCLVSLNEFTYRAFAQYAVCQGVRVPPEVAHFSLEKIELHVSSGVVALCCLVSCLCIHAHHVTSAACGETIYKANGPMPCNEWALCCTLSVFC